MPKLKTKKKVLKRVKITATGKLLRRTQNRRHLRRKKNRRALRAGKRPKTIAKGFEKMIRRFMPGA